MKQSLKSISFIFLSFPLVFYATLIGIEGGMVESGMAREGMGFKHRGDYHRSHGGYGYGRAYGSFGRHFGRYGHRGYDRHGSMGYVRREANPNDNIVASSSNGHLNSNGNARAIRTTKALENKSRGGKYWGYYSPHYQYGLYPWYNNGDPYYYYQRGDYYPWFWGYNPMWLWW